MTIIILSVAFVRQKMFQLHWFTAGGMHRALQLKRARSTFNPSEAAPGLLDRLGVSQPRQCRLERSPGRSLLVQARAGDWVFMQAAVQVYEGRLACFSHAVM